LASRDQGGLFGCAQIADLWADGLSWLHTVRIATSDA
jgi:hypothetical protein